MTKTFRTYDDLTSALVDDVIAGLPASVSGRFGVSGQSCSAYVEATIETVDDDGDETIETFKLRYSDHADRYGSDRTIRVDGIAREIEDDGEFDHLEISDDAFAALVADGLAAITTWQESL